MSDDWRPRILCLPTGPDEYAVAVVRALAAVAEITFVLPKAMLARYRDDLLPTVRVLPVRWPRHRDPRNLLLVATLARIVWRTKPDVIHFLGDSVTWLLLALPFIRCPIVVTVHDVRYHPVASVARKRDYRRFKRRTAWRDDRPEMDTVAQRVEFALDCFLTGVGIDYLYVLGRVRRFAAKLGRASGAAGMARRLSRLSVAGIRPGNATDAPRKRAR